MGQSVATRIEVRGTLVCLGPVHVGGWDNTIEANLTVARDGTGRPCLPGTSLAGALRAYLGGISRFDGGQFDVLNALFGHVTASDGSPSWVRVDDAHLIGADPALTVRDGVGIDRHSASAAANFLYTRQTLPAGTSFALRLVADTPADPATAGSPDAALVSNTVDAMVAGLTHGRVPIGAGRGRGYGRMELRDVIVRRSNLSDPAGLVEWLTGKAQCTALRLVHPPADGRLRITVGWRPVGPLLVRDSLPGTVVDTLPLTDTAADGTVRLLLPGSSIRGAVRAYAERIVRTLQGQTVPQGFQDMLRRPPPGVDLLFGSAPGSTRADPDGAKGWRGVVTVADCHSLGAVSTDQWAAIVTARPDLKGTSGAEEREEREQRNIERDQARSALRQQLAEINSSFALGISDHVAIDRWTGGAGDHRLFSVLEPDSTVAWEPISVEVDVARLERHDTAVGALALPLLLLVLRDLRDGWLSLGYGGTRGHGQIEVTEVTFDGDGLSAPWQSLTGQTLDAILTDPPTEIAAAMIIWENTFQEATA